MAAKVKSEATKARDKRLRRTAAEARAAGLRTNVTVRLTPEERASLESYAAMRGMTLSEAIRSRACHYSPDAEKAAEYSRKLYYGMRETGTELLESNSAVRIAYEENARAAFALSSAVRRVGVNVNQIAKKVNSGVVDDAEIWLAELQNCVQLLNEILQTGNVKSVRPIPPLETWVSEGGADALSEPPAKAEKEARKEPVETVVEPTGKRVDSAAEIDAEKSVGTDVKTAPKKQSEIEQKTGAETEPKTDAGKTSETGVGTKPKTGTGTKPKPKPKSDAGKTSDGKPKSARPPESDMSAKPGGKRVVPLADASRGETQEDVDAAWIKGLLDKKKPVKRKRDEGGISDEWRERLEMTVLASLPKGGRK